MLHLRELTLLFFSIVSLLNSAFAFSAQKAVNSGRPIFTLGAGVAMTSDVGTKKTFPIINPGTSELFQYSPNHAMQSSGLFQGFLGTEWQVDPKWLVQFGVDYSQASPFSSRGAFTQGADPASTNTYNYYYRVMTKQLLAESKLLYSFKERYHPYILVGLGAAFNKAYNYYTNAPPFLTFTRLYRSDSSTAFSYALGVGIDTDIRPDLRLGVGYRFTNLGQITLENAIMDTTSVGGTLAQSHLYENQLLAQLTFIF